MWRLGRGPGGRRSPRRDQPGCGGLLLLFDRRALEAFLRDRRAGGPAQLLPADPGRRPRRDVVACGRQLCAVCSDRANNCSLSLVLNKQSLRRGAPGRSGPGRV